MSRKTLINVTISVGDQRRDKDAGKVVDCQILMEEHGEKLIVFYCTLISLRRRLQARQTIPGLRHVNPGVGVDHDLLIVQQRHPPSSGLEQVPDSPQLVQLLVDLADVLQIDLETPSDQSNLETRTSHLIILLRGEVSSRVWDHQPRGGRLGVVRG